MDNTSAAGSLCKRLGGTHSLVLSNLALALWEWALKRKIILSAEHYAGRLNTISDWESRHFKDMSNWRLDTAVFCIFLYFCVCAWHVFKQSLQSEGICEDASKLILQLGGQAQTQFITPPGRSGKAGVSNGELIHFAPLWQI